MTEQMRKAIKEYGEKYVEQSKELDANGIAYVPWDVFRIVRCYLDNKGFKCKSDEIEIEEHYRVISINAYKDSKYIGTIVLLPDDTESKAYGKADKYIVNKIKEVK